MKRAIKVVMLCTLFLLAVISSTRAADISITVPWIREAPPAARMLAAYMTISNSSSHMVRLLSADSADFETIEIHRTEMQKGMSQMVKQSILQINGGSAVKLEPGGYHLMLMKPGHDLKAGEKSTLKLHFDNGEIMSVTAVVRNQ